ncbi:WD40/YVTN/BNR-like repeat-containing protein, partial [Klebsiella pneumoniae]|uniref:WD40/YVTN/BNR-like repeat-containing protein n=1 Tax=Klebsiella pneumoniae TaxID=573 RepID=UPI003A80D71B
DVNNSWVYYDCMLIEKQSELASYVGLEISYHHGVDGGESWERLEDGLPETMGKIGVAVSPADPSRVFAIVEAEEGGLYRSDDSGKSWKLINEDRVLQTRSWYYMHA